MPWYQFVKISSKLVSGPLLGMDAGIEPAHADMPITERGIFVVTLSVALPVS